MAATRLHVLRVFTDDRGAGGNPLGVFLDGAAVPPERRQAVAADLGFSETVFVEEPGSGRLRIFTPAVELPLAGHPLVGSAWLLREEGHAPTALRPPAGEVAVRFDGPRAFVAGRPEWAPHFEFVQVPRPDDVDALTGPPDGHGTVGVWAWIDEGAGTLRERVFAPSVGVPEDEATGAAAMRLVAALGCPITIHQGRGSVILARPLDGDRVEIGGRVVADEVRDYTVG